MKQISLDEIRLVAFETINENQENWSTEDNEKNMTYSLAYNDGILDLVEAIAKKLFPAPIKFDLGEAVDDK